MKANLYILLIVLLSFSAMCIAQNNDFSLYYFNSSKQVRFEQRTLYTAVPFKNWYLQFTGKSIEDNRTDFNQSNQNTSINLMLSNQYRKSRHSILSGFEYFYDHSLLEVELNPYINKTGFIGYGVNLNPMDSLYIGSEIKGYYRTEQDRYEANKHFISRGHYGKAFSGYGFGNEQKSLNISGEWESKKLNWESYRQANAILSANIINDFITATSNTIVSTRQDDLYVLESVTPEKQRSSYQRLDKQYRKRLNTDLNVMFSLGNSIGLTLYDSYSLQNYELQMNKSRNTGDYNNLAQISFSYYPVPNIELKSVNSHNYYIKDLSSIKNTRIIDTRKTSNSIIWGYNNADTLSINYTVELKRTMYPDSGNDMDNDYLSNNYRASWIIFYKDRIRISNHLLYIINDEIFIASELSANNNQSTSLQWQPECDILIGDCLMLMQDYQIRADYDNYYYSQTFSNIRDTFYRFVSCGYNLVYDTTPLAAKSIYTNWNNLPYRNRNSNAFRFELSYNWERNETSAQENGVYYINDTEERQAIGTVIQKQFGIGIYQLQPKYSWGYWKEYSMLLSALWQLNKNSSTEFIINPIGPDFNNLDWKISCSINLLF